MDHRVEMVAVRDDITLGDCQMIDFALIVQ